MPGRVERTEEEGLSSGVYSGACEQGSRTGGEVGEFETEYNQNEATKLKSNTTRADWPLSP